MSSLPDGAVRNTLHGVVSIRRDVLQDPSLSLDARGLYSYLASCHKLPSFDEMVAASSDGPRVTRLALEELIAARLVPADAGRDS